MKKQIIIGVSVGLLTTAIVASAKSIVDVKVLKTKVESLFTINKDTNDRIKRIETFLIQGKRI